MAKKPRAIHQAALGFKLWQVRPDAAMPAAHTHPDIELNYLTEGQVSYLHAGTLQVVPAGQLALFWGGLPHQSLRPGITGKGIWLTLPLSWFLQWRLPNGLPDRILQGTLLQIPAAPAQIERWLRDYESQNPSLHRALLLELESCLLRAALAAPVRQPAQPDPKGTSQVEKITGYLAAHYDEALTVPDIARAVGLHPKYLMRVFKKHCLMSVWEYLTRLRISHAQRLLVTTDTRVTDIALESGFGSPAAFYQAFATFAHGEKPLDYRRRHGGLTAAAMN